MIVKRPAFVRTKEYVWCQNGDYVGGAFFFKGVAQDLCYPPASFPCIVPIRSSIAKSTFRYIYYNPCSEHIKTSCCCFIKRLGKGFEPSPPYPGLRAPKQTQSLLG